MEVDHDGCDDGHRVCEDDDGAKNGAVWTAEVQLNEVLRRECLTLETWSPSPGRAGDEWSLAPHGSLSPPFPLLDICSHCREYVKGRLLALSGVRQRSKLK
ncbi:hypothetical protein CHS0354_037999 [Potamilus streckersoni]|uniref:Uncharacterized protein n=1 Tax=Potamilus streckersoni TaxID=2493646 RepID=A0AAE0TFZ8_9BIVA|nr:hypothetical protein CHS0354_037999 [Potamilus streckersoni]